eukprot:508209_1
MLPLIIKCSKILCVMLCVITMMITIVIVTNTFMFISFVDVVKIKMITKYLGDAFNILIFNVMLFKLITSFCIGIITPKSTIKYIHLSFAIFTIIYGTFCIVLINLSHDLINNCIYLILSSILCIQYIYPEKIILNNNGNNTQIEIEEWSYKTSKEMKNVQNNLGVICIKLFVMSLITYILTLYDLICSYHIWIYFIQCIIFKGNILSTKHLMIYWITFTVQYLDDNLSKEENTNIHITVYILLTMIIYKNFIHPNNPNNYINLNFTIVNIINKINETTLTKITLNFNYINYILLSVSIMIFLNCYTIWNIKNNININSISNINTNHNIKLNQQMLYLKLIECFICIVIITIDFNQSMNKKYFKSDIISEVKQSAKLQLICKIRHKRMEKIFNKLKI